MKNQVENRYRGISKGIRAVNGLLDYSLILLLLLALLYGCYALWDSQNLTQEATAEQYEIYKPEENELGFQELQQINPDVFGWISIYGTPIDYPIVQGEDNWEYINKNAEGEYALTGAIFLDAYGDPEMKSFHNIIYGHNMVPNVMFGSIKEFKEQSFFDSHLYGSLYVRGEMYGLEIFALIHADAYDQEIYRNNLTEDDREGYLEAISQRAVHERQIGVTVDDRILLLSTCSSDSTNGRDILVARITEEIFEQTEKEGT